MNRLEKIAWGNLVLLGVSALVYVTMLFLSNPDIGQLRIYRDTWISSIGLGMLVIQIVFRPIKVWTPDSSVRKVEQGAKWLLLLSVCFVTIGYAVVRSLTRSPVVLRHIYPVCSFYFMILLPSIYWIVKSKKFEKDAELASKETIIPFPGLSPVNRDRS
jgi:hypothetical protein